MHKEKSTSLFLPLLTGVLLLFIFLSGITEVACLASYAGKSIQPPKAVTARSTSSVDREKSTQKILSSVEVADVMGK